ncbi:MAG: hypothetical protein ACXQTL_04845 [Methanosarcinales archaeon]
MVEEKVKLVAHGDADGIYSAAEFMAANGYRMTDIQVVFPKKFGDCPADSTYVLDMVPIDPNLEAEVWDHHPLHPAEHRYKLHFDSAPTGLIIYKQFRRALVEKGKDWYVAGSLAGDGQPELIPPEVFRRHRQLLDDVLFIRESYGSYSVSSYPCYLMLSAAVNNLGKIGHPEVALQIVLDADNPLEIIHNDKVRQARDQVSKETSRAIKLVEAVDLKYVQLAIFESEYAIQSTVARKLHETSHKTVVAFNRALRALSIRGPLSAIVVEKLRPLCTEVGGHLGYAGGTLKATTSIPQLQDALRDVL